MERMIFAKKKFLDVWWKQSRETCQPVVGRWMHVKLVACAVHIIICWIRIGAKNTIPQQLLLRATTTLLNFNGKCIWIKQWLISFIAIIFSLLFLNNYIFMLDLLVNVLLFLENEENLFSMFVLRIFYPVIVGIDLSFCAPCIHRWQWNAALSAFSL